MSEEEQSPKDARRRIAEAFNRDVDPLAKHDETFKQMDSEGIDPFEMFLDDVIRDSSRRASTVDEYERAIDHFKQFMRTQGRHPACPNADLVQAFVDHEFSERGNGKDTAKTKLGLVNKAYKYMQNEPQFPHTQEYNPFESAREKISWEKGEPEEAREYPKVTIDELRAAIAQVTHIKKRAMILMNLKLGMRQGEVRNAQIETSTLRTTNYNVTTRRSERIPDWETVPTRFISRPARSAPRTNPSGRGYSRLTTRCGRSCSSTS
jgi:integrase/recombinase XerD